MVVEFIFIKDTNPSLYLNYLGSISSTTVLLLVREENGFVIAPLPHIGGRRSGSCGVNTLMQILYLRKMCGPKRFAGDDNQSLPSIRRHLWSHDPVTISRDQGSRSRGNILASSLCPASRFCCSRSLDQW